MKEDCDAYVDQFGVELPPGAGSLLWHEQLLQVYFDQVQQFRFRGSVAEKVLKQFGEDVKSETFSILQTYQLTRFDAPHKIVLGEKRAITLRPITREDLVEYGTVPQGLESNHFFRKSDPMSESGWICQIEILGHKATYFQDWNENHRSIDKVLNALMLTRSGGLLYQHIYRRLASPFIFGPTMMRGKSVSLRLPGSLTLNKADIYRLRVIYRQLERIAEEDHFEHLHLPLRRLTSFGSRVDDEDRITDVVIALERLLAYDSKSEIAYRFRLRGAAVLPESFGSIKERLNLMKDLYDLRSDIVHGNTGPKTLKTATEKMDMQQRIRYMIPKSEQVLRAVFRWYLDHLDYWIPEEGASKDETKRKLVQTLDAWMVEGASRDS